eukprot:m.91148 g.91148  ORF g.91148 m.91148 type:complete len:53 (-) comp16486_c0_seq5:2905-3063(-)
MFFMTTVAVAQKGLQVYVTKLVLKSENLHVPVYDSLYRDVHALPPLVSACCA